MIPYSNLVKLVGSSCIRSGWLMVHSYCIFSIWIYLFIPYIFQSLLIGVTFMMWVYRIIDVVHFLFTPICLKMLLSTSFLNTLQICQQTTVTLLSFPNISYELHQSKLHDQLLLFRSQWKFSISVLEG